MKKWIAVFLLMLSLLALGGCGKSRVIHCDGCGKEIKVAADSKMTEDWIILCEDCQKLLD